MISSFSSPDSFLTGKMFKNGIVPSAFSSGVNLI